MGYKLQLHHTSSIFGFHSMFVCGDTKKTPRRLTWKTWSLVEIAPCALEVVTIHQQQARGNRGNPQPILWVDGVC